MLIKPILIIGAPRSGTSLLQKILRNHPAVWSLPSESDIVWDQYCHPKLRQWESEAMDESHMVPSVRDSLLRQFEDFARPARFWKPFEKMNLIWGFRRVPVMRRAMRGIFEHVFPRLRLLSEERKPKRFVEKTASNCFRLGFVNEVFPDARIVYVTRDGRNNVNSLINAWLHPNRFFTYNLPVMLQIDGYPHGRWKFVLPPGWREYVARSLEEVCAFQWRSCHEAVLEETVKPKYEGRVLRIKLEELVHAPDSWLRRLAEFIDLPYDDYFRSVAAELPVVNSPDNDTSQDKWRAQNQVMVERVLPLITPMMRRLHYEV